MTDVMQRVSGKLERAIRNSTKLHLALDEALAIYASEAGRQIALLAREEMLAGLDIPPLPAAHEPPRPVAGPPQSADRPLTDEQRLKVDEAARRRAWDVINNIKTRQRRGKSQRANDRAKDIFG